MYICICIYFYTYKYKFQILTDIVSFEKNGHFAEKHVVIHSTNLGCGRLGAMICVHFDPYASICIRMHPYASIRLICAPNCNIQHTLSPKK